MLIQLAHGVKAVLYHPHATQKKLHNIYHHLYSSVMPTRTKLRPTLARSIQIPHPVMPIQHAHGVKAVLCHPLATQLKLHNIYHRLCSSATRKLTNWKPTNVLPIQIPHPAMLMQPAHGVRVVLCLPAVTLLKPHNIYHLQSSSATRTLTQ